MKKLTAEFIGTFAIIFFGTGSIITSATHIGISLTFGLIVLSMIYCFEHISSNFNPAVTLGLFLTKKLEPKLVIPYIIAQCLGGIAASLGLHLLFPANSVLGGTHPSGTCLQSFILEVIMTFFLVLVVLNTLNDKMAGIVIGSLICSEALFGGPISGASMNPARSLGPALVSLNFEHLWIYLTAPFIGSFLATLVYRK